MQRWDPGARGAASAAFVIENRFRKVGGEAPAAPIRAEIKKEMTGDENDANHTFAVKKKQTYECWTGLLKRRGSHTCGVAPVTPNLNRVSSEHRGGGHGIHAARSEYSHQWACFFVLCSPFWLLLCRKSEKLPFCVMGMKLSVLSCCPCVDCPVMTCM